MGPISPYRFLPLACRVLPAAVLLLAAVPARAQDVEPIETDRPDISNTSKVVGAGTFQVETGVQRELFRTGGRSQRSWFTPTLLRLGVSDRWEARVGTNGYSRARFSEPGFGSDRTSGYSPISVGAKVQFQDPPQGSRRPSLGAMVDVQLPSGSSRFATDRVTGVLRLAGDWELTDRLSLNANLGAGIGEHEEGDFGSRRPPSSTKRRSGSGRSPSWPTREPRPAPAARGCSSTAAYSTCWAGTRSSTSASART